MNIRLMALPLLCFVGVATAAGVEKEATGGEGEPVAVQAQVREKATAGKVKRQGGDMRHCLNKKTDKAIIRCAEPGRKP
ncbi:MAG: hypothetical protein H6R09_410 [Proteobacteria bacterium]|jgi:hypothetical protein|nr:hypothetical protein [Pseudomonadota bacterium]